MSGSAHLPYLVCSLYTLRKWYNGFITVGVWPETCDFVELIAKDSRVRIDRIIKQEPPFRKKDGVGGNSQFLHKIKLTQELKDTTSAVVYLDADTTVHGSIDCIFQQTATFGFAATQFNDWTTKRRVIKKRITQLYTRSSVDKRWIDMLLKLEYPSVNGGVWGAVPQSPVLMDWFDRTVEAKNLFIADEVVLHAMMSKYVSGKGMCVLTNNGKWNCSPKYQPKTLADDSIVIRHYHGDSNVRPGKSQKGFDLWWPIYQECLDKNIGNINHWIHLVYNKHLRALKDIS